MKKILITGANSYIGTSFENWLEKYHEKYYVDTINVKSNTWKEKDFSDYDVILHVAGIAHIKETKENAHLYYEINRDLTIELAKKAKKEGVKHFLFISSISVYGVISGTIKKDSVPKPKNNYAKSKLQAEDELNKLIDDNFKVCILRPPMVYGKGCKGNFQTLVKLARMFPVFPKIDNKRSMVYIDNLCEFIRLCVDQNFQGIYVPQNSEYVRTDVMVLYLASYMGRKIYLSKFLGATMWFLKFFILKVEKAFGSLIYYDTEEFDFSYCIVGFEESIKSSMEIKV